MQAANLQSKKVSKAKNARFGVHAALWKYGKGQLQMTIETSGELGKRLCDELRRSEKCTAEFAAITGITNERCATLKTNNWEDLTLKELAAISHFLGLDAVERCLSSLK